MKFDATQEMEYLGSMERPGEKEPPLVHELSRQLDALRRFDQCFCDADWKPRKSRRTNRHGKANRR
jgi:hypothetical protein